MCFRTFTNVFLWSSFKDFSVCKRVFFMEMNVSLYVVGRNLNVTYLRLSQIQLLFFSIEVPGGKYVNNFSIVEK